MNKIPIFKTKHIELKNNIKHSSFNCYYHLNCQLIKLENFG